MQSDVSKIWGKRAKIMKKSCRFLSLMLVFCMMAVLGVWNTDAHADWRTVQFTKVENKNFENVPTGINPEKLTEATSGTTAATADPSAGTTAGAKTEAGKPGQIEYFYNPWAGTLVIRGKGAMPGFDEKHPAPWHTESKRALRVIIDEGVTTIPNEAFKDFEKLQSIVFPSTLKAIAASAFEKCEKLKRVEVVIEEKEAEKLIKESESKELLKDDVKIIRVTKEAIRREVCWLTTYWVNRIEVYRDKAGRPIRIIEHKCDGFTVDTEIQYLNPATAVNSDAKSLETAERIYSVITSGYGEKYAKERELDEYGKTLVKGEYELNWRGRQVSGTEITFHNDDADKRTLNRATYYTDGTGTKYWSSVGTYGGTTQIIEQVDKNDRILSVSSITYDQNGIVSEITETENNYNSDGNKTSTIITQIDNSGEVTATQNTRYRYNGLKQLIGKTVTEANQYYTSETTSEYSYDNSGNLKTINERSDNSSSKLTEYQYTDQGKKTSKTVTATAATGQVDRTETRFDDYERATEEKTVSKDDAGKTFSTTVTEYSYNSNHRITQSVSITTDADGNKKTSVTNYDPDGRIIKESSVNMNSSGTSTETRTVAYDADGNVTSSRRETKQADGTTTISSYEAAYDARGRVVSEKRYDPSTEITTNNRYSYDGYGRITKEVNTLTDIDGTTTSTTTVYTYHADGSFTKKIVPLTTEEKTTVTITDVGKDGTEGETKQETVETAAIQEEIKTAAAPSSKQLEGDNETIGGIRTMAAGIGNETQGGLTVLLSAMPIANSDGALGASNRTLGSTGAAIFRSLNALPVHEKEEDHEYNVLTGSTASCEEDGVETWTCICGAEKEIDVEAYGHSPEEVEEEAATCTAAGHTAGTVCSRCDEVLEGCEEIPALGHSPEEVEEKAATCTAAGHTAGTVCSCCDEALEGCEAIAALGHNYTSEVTKEPTCGAEGVRTYTCGRCGDTYTESIEKTAHTCTSEVTKEPTCGEEGVRTYTCTVCGDTHTESIEKTAHSYTSEVTEEPTCEATGVRTYTCTVCSDSYTEEIPALGHSYGETFTPATCTEAGYKTCTCARCGDSYQEQTEGALGHSYTSAVTEEPTCESGGVRTYTCVRCPDSYTETIPALGHSYGETFTPATCTEAGYKIRTCARCGDSYQEQTEGALGHSYTSAVTEEPTCEAGGVRTYTCVRCPDSYAETIPALGHRLGEPYDNGEGVMVQKCAVCQAVIPVP